MGGPGAGCEFGTQIETFRALVDRSEVAALLVVTHPDGSALLLAANPAAQAVLRIDELVGLDFADLVDAVSLPIEKETIARSADGRIDVVSRVRPYRRGDGSTTVLNGFTMVLERIEGAALNAVVLVERHRTDWTRRLIGYDAHVTAAIAEMRGALLRGDPIDEVLTSVCDHTCELMAADSTGLLEVIGERSVLRAGDRASTRPVGASWPIPEGEFGDALRANRRIRASSDGAHLVNRAGVRVMPELGDDEVHMALAPVEAGGAAYGALAVRRRSLPFTEEQLSVLEAFAQGVAETLGVAAARAELERLRVLEVRQGIARDLHDEVIQDLIALRLQLVGLVPKAADPGLARSLEEVRDELNRTTIRLRNVVAGLQEDPDDHFEDAVRALTGSRAQRQGIDWNVTVMGLVDDLPGDLRADVLRVLNESVSNVLRHSGARRVDVGLVADAGRLELTVTDDGIGPEGATGSPGMGLANLRTRAYDRGGECSFGAGPDGGSVLTWWVPAPEPGSENAVS